MKHRLFALGTAALLALTVLTGCGEKQNQQNSPAANELPYGAHITEYSRGNMKIACDARFLDEAVVDLIAQYYHAIENQDGAALEEVLFPIYNDYQLTEVYGGEITNQDIVDRTHEAIKEYFGFDFAYSYIDVYDVISKDAQSNNRDSLAAMLDSLAEEKGEPSISEETDALLEMEIDRYCAEKDDHTAQETDNVLTGEILYAIKYRGEWYLMYS